MTHADLDVLEREVEQARSRFVGDLARLSNPSVVSEFKHDVVSRASRAKDDLLHQATDATTSTANRILTDIKNRAAANPAAALAIGAGLAWRFARNPPISTILVGLGVLGLIKTNASSGPSPVVTRAREAAESATELAGNMAGQAREWGSRARQATDEAVGELSSMVATGVDKLRETAETVSDKVARTASAAAGSAQASADGLRDWSSEARQAMSVRMEEASVAGTRLHETVTHRVDQMQHAARDTAQALTGVEARDNYLLGAAALAVGAAAIISYRRRDD